MKFKATFQANSSGYLRKGATVSVTAVGKCDIKGCNVTDPKCDKKTYQLNGKGTWYCGWAVLLDTGALDYILFMGN